MTRWAFCKFRFTPTMPVCVIWLLKTKYFYSILFHFSVPMKNIQHNSNGSWMFFRLNVKWRKLQGKSEDRIMKYSWMIAVCMLWPWTDGLQSLVSYSEWRGISMAASSTSTSPFLWAADFIPVCRQSRPLGGTDAVSGENQDLCVTVCGCRICCRVHWERHHLILN